MNEGSSNTLTLPVIRLRQYNKSISLVYTIDKMNNENSKLAQMLVGTAISGCEYCAAVNTVSTSGSVYLAFSCINKSNKIKATLLHIPT